MVQRDRQDEALGVIIRLLRGEERFSYDSEWFTLRDAQLQILPLQERHADDGRVVDQPVGHDRSPASTASARSRSHRRRPKGLQALPTQWSFAEDAAQKHGKTVDRKNWRVLMIWHLAESKKQAEEEAKLGLQRWHNEYNVRVLGRPDAKHVDDPDELMDQFVGRGAAGAGVGVVGTPDELVDGDPQPARGHRRLRRRPRLRPRLGEPRGDPPLVGAVRALRHARSQRLLPQPGEVR